MHKLNNIQDVTPIPRLIPLSKATADLFEVIAAKVCMTTNFETLTAWVGRLFQPLIKVAVKIYFE